MYKLYIANRNYSSWSLRAWLLMRQSGVAFEEVLVPFEAGSSWQRFRRFSPSGQVPCLHDGPTRVWDSLAIAEFLAERHAGIWPGDARARAWARSAAAEMHAGFRTLRECCSMSCGQRIRLHERPAALEAELQRLEEIWTEGLASSGGPFLAGAAFTAVDASYAPVAFRLQTYGIELGTVAAAYAARLLALPAMREWYAAALAEIWREPAHEAALSRAGTLLADLRVS